MQPNLKTQSNGPRIEIEAHLYDGSVTIQRGDFGRQKHAYYWKEKDLFVPGVTSILGILDKPALIPWAAKMAGEYVKTNLPENPTKEQVEAICEKAKTEYNTIKETAGGVGTKVHSIAECLFKGQPIEIPDDPQVTNGVKALQEWISDNDVQPIDVETIVFSKSAYFAGTMDLLASVNGKLTQVDLKSGSGIYNEHYFQTASYKFAWEEEHKEVIQQIIILNTNKKTGKAKIRVIEDEDEMQFYTDTFLRVKAVSDNLKKMDNYGNGMRR